MSDDLSLDARVLRFRSDGDAERGPAFARELLEAQRPREALEVLSRAVAARPDDAELLRLAARALLADGDPLRAQQTLTRVIRANPEDVDAYLLLADALRARGDAGRADAALAKARSLSPGVGTPAAVSAAPPAEASVPAAMGPSGAAPPAAASASPPRAAAPAAASASPPRAAAPAAASASPSSAAAPAAPSRPSEGDPAGMATPARVDAAPAASASPRSIGAPAAAPPRTAGMDRGAASGASGVEARDDVTASTRPTESAAAPTPSVPTEVAADPTPTTPGAPRVETNAPAETSEREELQQDVADLLATAMKTASAHPPAPVGGVPAVSVPTAAPVPAPHAPSAAAASSAPRVAPSHATAVAAPHGVPSRAPIAPRASASGADGEGEPPQAPTPRPGPRRSPTLLGFAPPRPPARPASVPPPANTAPLPAIRPPSVRPPSLGAALPPPVVPPPVVPPPGRAAQLKAPAASPPGSDEDEDMPTAFMDRESLVNALAEQPSGSASAQQAGTSAASHPAPTADAATEASASKPGPSTAQLADTLPEFAVSADAAVVPVVLPKNAALPALGLRSGARPRAAEAAGEARAEGKEGPRASTSSAPQSQGAEAATGPVTRGVAARSASGTQDDVESGAAGEAASQVAAREDAAAESAEGASRPKRRWGVAVALGILLSLGAGVGAHVAGLLPPAWSRAIDTQLGALRGAPEATRPANVDDPTSAADQPPPTTSPAPAAPVPPEPTATPAEPDAFERALASGQVPEGLTALSEGDAATDASALRVRSEALLLQLAPWWSDEPLDAADATRAVLLDAIARALAAGDTDSVETLALRASALRLSAAVLDTETLAAARALADELPDEPLAQWTLAEALIAHGDTDDADRLLTRIVADGPETMRARALVQRAWLAHQRDDAALEREALEQALALAPEWELVTLRLTDLRLDAGDYRAVLDALSADDAEVTPARTVRRLRASLGLEDFEGAEALFAQLPEPSRADPRFAPVLAQFHLMRGEPAEAVGQLTALATPEAADPSVIALYADALYEAGRTLEASAQYERAIARDGSHPEALIGFSQVLLRAHKHREARVNLDRAEAGLRTRVRPPATLARLRVMRARVMVADREMAQAATLLRRTLEIPGAPSEGWFYLGEALSGSHSPEARAAYERYLALHPVGPLAARARRAIQ